MAKVKLNFTRLPITEKAARAKQIVAALTSNANFPTPSPDLTVIQTTIAALNTAYDGAQTARQTAKEKTAVLNEKEADLDQLMTKLAAYVESIAGDQEDLILSAGMDMREKAVSASDVPAQPQALTATAGDHDGEVDLTWDKVAGSKSYVIEKSADPPTGTSWSHAAVSTKSAYTITGLNSGTRYWFRVASVNNNGQSGWSDPAMKIAP